MFNRWTRIEPKTAIYYPDKGGSVGYSICTWDIPKNTTWEKVLLLNQWGGFSPQSVFAGGVYRPFVLEGRLFVFGSLLSLAVVINDISIPLDQQWRPVMDEILKDIEVVLEKNRTSRGSGVHIDEVVTQTTAEKLRSNLYLNRSEYFSSRGWR